jgi:pimeloyl-ACP methyl ester carboxylesterase
MTPTQKQNSNEIAGKPTFRLIDGLSIRFVESEPRGADALLLSPWPESVLAYEPTWSRLAEKTHLIAIDPPGFGHSEGREDVMSPRAVGEFIVRVADAFGLAKPHVIAPDIGTSTALFAASRHAERFLSLVVGSGGAAFPLNLEGPLREWVFAPDLEPYRRIGGEQIVERVLATLERYRVSDVAREEYLASYRGDRFAESMRYVRSYPTELELLQSALPLVQTPVQIITGRMDAVVPLANAEYLHERLPKSELHVVDAGHFTWEDDAAVYATLVEGWWAGGFATVAPEIVRPVCS